MDSLAKGGCAVGGVYDLLVIGAGPGGYVAAIRAAQLGMRVACADKNELGGTCLNVGCIPSKALLDSSELYYQAGKSFGKHGIRLGSVDLDIPAMMKRKETIVKTLTGGVAGLFRRNKVDILRGRARILKPGAAEIAGADGGTQTVEAKRILIATGSEPVELPFLKFDGTHIVSSAEALRFEKVPDRLIVIGAGAVGLELGSVWSRLGAEVLVVEFKDSILPGMDREMTGKLQQALETQGLKFRLGSSAKSAETADGKVKLTVETGSETTVEECGKVLVSVGRRPHTEGLGLEDIGVKTDSRGRIEVNERYETNVEGIYAIGDVIPGVMLAHKAEDEGIAAAELMAGKAGHVNYNAIANVVYTHPELASVGISGQEAEERGLRVRTGRFPLTANGRAQCMDETAGLVKILADAKTDKALGIHILAPRASDLIAEGSLAMEFGASAEDIARTVHAHPTLTEAVKEAALAVDGRAIHIAK